MPAMTETFRADAPDGLRAVTDAQTVPSPRVRERRAGGVPRWQRRYVLILLLLDTAALLAGGLIGQEARFETLGGAYGGVSYHRILVLTAPVWILTLAVARTYEGRYLGLGSEEFHRVTNAAARFTAVLAIAVFLFKWDIARGLVVGALPTAAVLTLGLRYTARKVLHRLRRRGRASHRVLLVGDGPARDTMRHRLLSSPHSGLQIVGTCSPTSPGAGGRGSVEHVPRQVRALRADTVAVTYSPDLDPDLLRRLAWAVEGLGVDLLVAPALTDVAGPRVSIRPVSGLPLLQVAEPEFTGARRIVKRAVDTALAGTALLLGAPVLLLVGLAVRFSGAGPVLFRQIRIGKDGRRFVIYKFRSMYHDAESRRAEVLAFNDHSDGVLFKMRDDPRITPVGRYLRRFSLDELPQLVNVLVGQMSVVGPRPPLPDEVARYPREAHRRLLVKPGLTGLWQRALGPQLGGVRAAGPLLRGELVRRPRRRDHLEDDGSRPARGGRALAVLAAGVRVAVLDGVGCRGGLLCPPMRITPGAAIEGRAAPTLS